MQNVLPVWICLLGNGLSILTELLNQDVEINVEFADIVTSLIAMIMIVRFVKARRWVARRSKS